MHECLSQYVGKYLRLDRKPRIGGEIGQQKGVGLGTRILVALHLFGLSLHVQAVDTTWDWATLNSFGPTINGTGTYNYTNVFNSGLDAVVTISANFPDGGSFAIQPSVANNGVDQELQLYPNFGARDPSPNRTDPATATHTVRARIEFFEGGSATAAAVTIRDLIIRDIDGSNSSDFQDNVFVADTGGVPATGPTASSANPTWTNDYPGTANSDCTSDTDTSEQESWAEYEITASPVSGFEVTHYAGNGCGDSNPNQQRVWVSDFVFSTPEDFGDARAEYGDASHTIPVTPLIYLGSQAPDAEPASQTTRAANGDDRNNIDDEDGVTFSSAAGGGDDIIADVAVTNTTGSPVTVCGWLDTDRSRSFDADERQCNTAIDPSTSFSWLVGDTTADRNYFSRFRVCSTAAECDAPTGAASDGEVEDYRVRYSPTHATIGDVSLEESAVAELLGALDADLLALLAIWDPDLAVSLEGAEKATIEQALSNYLDPDGDGAVAVLRWNTLEERGTVGFYAERRTAGENSWHQLNDGLLRGLVDAPLGGQYWLADPQAQAGETYSYRLIEQEAWGSQRRYGPWQLSLGQAAASPAPTQPAAVRQGRVQRISATKQRLDGDETRRWSAWQALGAGFGARKRLPQASVEVKRRPARAPSEASGSSRAAALSATTLSANAAQRLAAAADMAELQTAALWLHTKAEGLHRIPVAELAARTTWSERRLRLWLQRGRRLALSNAGAPVAWHYEEAEDALLFVAESYRSIHGDENAYRLFNRGASTRTMAVRGGAGPNPGTPDGYFREGLHFEQDLIYSLWSVLDDAQADYWFWDHLYGGFQDRLDIELPLPDALPSGQGELRIALRGWTDLAAGNDHRVRAELNGQALGSAIAWDGFEQALLVVSFDQKLLHGDGNNTLTLVTEYEGEEHPGQWLDWVEVDYWRAPLAKDGQLWLHDLEAGTHTVGALAGAEVYLIEAPLSAAPIWREDFSLAQDDDGGWQVTFEAPAGGDYLVVEAAALKDPRIRADLPLAVGLKRRKNRADYLIVAPRALAATATALREYRSIDFPQIRIVWLDDIYETFSHGRPDPAAIGTFLARVRKAWRGVPALLTLLGKGTLDHKDRLGYGDSLLPLPMTLTPWGLAPADNPNVDIDGDGLMDFAYARLPVSTDGAGLAYLEKLRAYESGPPSPWRALLAADDPDNGGDFDLNTSLLAEELQDYGYAVTSLFHPEDPLRAALTDPDSWETAFLGYNGHGGATQLGNAGAENFLTISDVPALSNNALPVLSALTCAVGDDSQPGDASLGATLVLSPAGGAIAALAPTGLSLDGDAQVIGSAFAAALLGEQRSVGKAARQAQQNSFGLVSPFMLGIYQVLGEPAVRVP